MSYLVELNPVRLASSQTLREISDEPVGGHEPQSYESVAGGGSVAKYKRRWLQKPWMALGKQMDGTLEKAEEKKRAGTNIELSPPWRGAWIYTKMM